MIITLKQREIEQAVRKHLTSLLGVAAGVNFEITFAATRGEAGLTATVDLEERDDTQPVQQVQTQRPVLAAVAPAVAATPPSPLAAAFAPEPVKEAQPEVQAVDESGPVEEQPAVVETPVKSGTSLFG